jgi:hypothetical protein
MSDKTQGTARPPSPPIKISFTLGGKKVKTVSVTKSCCAEKKGAKQ